MSVTKLEQKIETQEVGGLFPIVPPFFVIGIFAFFSAFLYFLSVFIQPESVQVFGNKTVAIFDLWSLQHFLSGIVISHIFWIYKRGSFLHLTICVFVIAYVWELVELLMEIGWFGSQIQSWFAGVEMPFNRYIADPVLLFLGAITYFRVHNFVKPVAVLVFMFLCVNLFMPNVLHIQQILTNL